MANNNDNVDHINHITDKARKACFKLRSYYKHFGDIPIKTLLYLFDMLVSPILEYASEIWFKGGKNFEQIERFHLKYLKNILHVKTQTCTIGVLGEVARFPLKIKFHVQSLKYWARIIALPKSDKLSIAYHHLLDIQKSTNQSNWTTSIKTLLLKCDMEKYWDLQNIDNIDNFVKLATKSLQSKFIDEWTKTVKKQPILRTYVTFKEEFIFEEYLNINEAKYRIALSQLRLSSHQLEIEKGRHHNPKSIPIEKRLCKFCNQNAIEDEFHFLLECSQYADLRKTLFNSLKDTILFPKSSKHIFKTIMNSNTSNARKVGNFLIKATTLRNDVAN